MIVITNNEDVRAEYEDKTELRFVEGGYWDVLVAARDLVHLGHNLLTHPLMGSLKPNETPYRSVALSADRGNPDGMSLMLMENALETFRKFNRVTRPDRGINTPPSMLKDFRLIDLSLMKSALDRQSGAQSQLQANGR